MYLIPMHPDLIQSLNEQHPSAKYLSFPGPVLGDAIAYFARSLAASLTRLGSGDPDAILCFDYPSSHQSRTPLRLYLMRPGHIGARLPPSWLAPLAGIARKERRQGGGRPGGSWRRIVPGAPALHRRIPTLRALTAECSSYL
jgi:hypothetical protein